jgi:hypothetical protein
MLTERIDHHAINVDSKVSEGSAYVTPKVAVRCKDRVIPRLGIVRVHDAYQIGVEKGMQCVVHRSLGQRGYLLDQAAIDLVGGGVPPDVTEELENPQPLVGGTDTPGGQLMSEGFDSDTPFAWYPRTGQVRMILCSEYI